MIGRIVDIVVSFGVLTVLSPLLVLIALAVVADSSGGPLYRGRRAGKCGRVFRMFKFRTMVSGADKCGAPITGSEDPRVTAVGRVLRRLKLDELPQFLNVLAGEMTLVGPRPEAPEIVAQYTPEQRTVLRVKPGITGWVQVRAMNEESDIPKDCRADEYYVRHLMHGKLCEDLAYLETRTAWSDTRIVFLTAGKVLRLLLSKG